MATQMVKESSGPKSGPAPSVVLELIQLDTCTGVPLFVGTGDPVVLPFQIAGNLSSASFAGTVPVFDLQTFNLYNVDVNLTWTATGPAERHNDHDQFRDAGIFFNTVTVGVHAPAVATGTVILLGKNLTPEPSDSAEIQTQNTGTITIETTSQRPSV
jgi:hypothetical protein